MFRRAWTPIKRKISERTSVSASDRHFHRAETRQRSSARFKLQRRAVTSRTSARRCELIDKLAVAIIFSRERGRAKTGLNKRNSRPLPTKTNADTRLSSPVQKITRARRFCAPTRRFVRASVWSTVAAPESMQNGDCLARFARSDDARRGGNDERARFPKKRLRKFPRLSKKKPTPSPSEAGFRKTRTRKNWLRKSSKIERRRS